MVIKDFLHLHLVKLNYLYNIQVIDIGMFTLRDIFFILIVKRYNIKNLLKSS